MVGSVSAETYHNKWHKVNIDFDEKWEIKSPTEDAKYLLLSLDHKELIASLNVYAYKYLEVVTMNGFQERRKTSGYDGWINLGERLGTTLENERANVEDSYVAIYAKKQLNEQLGYDKLLVAEYYFVKDKTGYVVSVRTLQNQWKDLKAPFQTVLKSFWVGLGERPPFNELQPEVSNWSVRGGVPTNEGFVPHNVESLQPLNLLATMTLTGFENAPLFIGDEVILSGTKGIEKRSRKEGALIWAKEGPLKSQVVHHGPYLFATSRSANGTVIRNWNLETGALVYEKPVSKNVTVSPVVNQGILLLVSAKAISAFHAKSGSPLWDLELESPVKFYPVMNSIYTVLVLKDGSVVCLDTGSGELLWREILPYTIKVPPIIQDKQLLIMGLRKQSFQVQPVVDARALKDGDLKWHYRHTGKSNNMSHFPILQEGVLYAIVHLQDEAELLAIKTDTGERQWASSFLLSPQTLEGTQSAKRRFLLTPKEVITSVFLDEEPQLVSFSRDTGDMVTRMRLSQIDEMNPGAIFPETIIGKTVVLRSVSKDTPRLKVFK